MQLAYPYLLLLAPLLLWLGLRKSKREHAVPMLMYGKIEGAKNIKIWLRKYMHLLPLLASLLMLLGLTRPQVVETAKVYDGEGLNIVLALDISGSMLATDFSPNRLEIAKQTAANFIASRPGDNIGLVIFSGESVTLSPLTTDQDILQQMIQQVQCGQLADGTAIGMGLATAVDKIKDVKAKNKIIILLTDGVDNSQVLEPITALEIAKTYGAKIYTIGVGTRGMAMSPVMKDPFGEWIMEYKPVEIDEVLLQRMASETGGRYFRAIDNSSLSLVYDEINRLEKSKLKGLTQYSYHELFAILIASALMLLIIYIIIKWWISYSIVD
jgi:Ca-activated chloride channel family protein